MCLQRLTDESINDKDQSLVAKAVGERRRDHLSHYILRLAYCRTLSHTHTHTPHTLIIVAILYMYREDMRRWFLGLETELLRMRFREVLGLAERAEFFTNYKDDFNFDVVSSEDCDVRLHNYFIHCSYSFLS